MKKVLGALVIVAVMAACGGGDDDDSPAVATTDASDSATTAATEPDESLPAFIGDFDRVCTTQVGFSGAASYEEVAGVHPMVFLEQYRGGNFIESSRTFPEGWVVKQDTDFEDNSEFEEIQLIACSELVEEHPTGQECELDDDGDTVTLELVSATYDVTVYEAITGDEVHTARLEATADECPFLAVYEKGDTTYVVQPSDDDYINALKDIVAP